MFLFCARFRLFQNFMNEVALSKEKVLVPHRETLHFYHKVQSRQLSRLTNVRNGACLVDEIESLNTAVCLREMRT